MNIRIAKKEDIKQFNDLASYCFGNPFEEHKLYDDIFDLENTRIVEQDGKFIGGYTLYDFDMTYGKDTAKMGGLSCVVMDVDARYDGNAKKMLIRMIEEMHEKEFVFGTLGAFNFEFYRKLGWEIAFEKMKFEADVELFEPYLTSEYEIDKYYKVPSEKIMELQKEFAKKYNGYIPRDKQYWSDYEKIIENAKYLTATVSLNETVEGYIIYSINNGKFDVREMVYSDTESLKALLGFIYRHNSQRKKVTMKVPCDFPLRLLVGDHYRLKSEIVPFMMNRVIDVKKAFEMGDYPNIGEYTIALKIDDSVADWNDGVWNLYLSQGNIRAEKGEADDLFDAKISIQELSRMIIGYVSGKTLLEIGAIETESQEAKHFIESVFVKKPTFINNMY